MRLNYTLMRRLADLKLSPDQYVVLRWLAEAIASGLPGLSQKDLCERMTSDPNTIAAMMGRMEKAALIRRVPDPIDRRRRIVSSTAEGRKVFKIARDRALALEKEALRGLSTAERTKFIDVLASLAQSCQDTWKSKPEHPAR